LRRSLDIKTTFISERTIAAENTAATRTNASRNHARAGRWDARLYFTNNTRETISRSAIFFRIIDAKVAHFLSLSVAVHMILVPRLIFFDCAPDFARARVDLSIAVRDSGMMIATADALRRTQKRFRVFVRHFRCGFVCVCLHNARRHVERIFELSRISETHSW
jgi:hypothetical protein